MWVSDTEVIIGSFYLVAAALFFIGLKLLGDHASAKKGNLLAAIGMLIAVVVTLLDQQVLNYEMIVLGIVIGSAIGAVMARTIRMTAMPQLVAIFNGVGGCASALIAGSEFIRLSGVGLGSYAATSIMISTLIGLVTF